VLLHEDNGEESEIQLISNNKVETTKHIKRKGIGKTKMVALENFDMLPMENDASNGK